MKKLSQNKAQNNTFYKNHLKTDPKPSNQWRSQGEWMGGFPPPFEKNWSKQKNYLKLLGFLN